MPQKRNGKYPARVRMPDGKEYYKRGFATLKEKKAHEAEIKRKLQQDSDYDPKAGSVTFREVAAEWLGSRESDVKPSTLDGYRYALAPAAQRRGDGKTLGIDASFGGYPLKSIKRQRIQEWIQRMTDAGKKPSTVRHACEIVRMVLEQAVHDGRLTDNPADHVKLPSVHNNSGVIDDPDMFLTPEQVALLTDATPWPYNVAVHLSAWSGVRAGELAGLQIGDVDTKGTGALEIQRTVRVIGGKLTPMPPKTKGSRRTVPLTPHTTEMLREYLAAHPHGPDKPGYDRTAPLFPNLRSKATKPTGVKAKTNGQSAPERQAHALALLTVAEAQARLVPDWASPMRHGVFYKAVYRPAVLRANRLAGYAALPPRLSYHALRHTFASICAAAALPTRTISRFMGHAKPSTTEGIYEHLFKQDHAEDMAALGALAAKPAAAAANNVVPFKR